LTSLTSSQSVSFRPGTNVEFNDPGFTPGTVASSPEGVIPPLDGYNLETLSNKNRDFSNPMYDAVQSGTTNDPNLGKSF
jgi:low density lipoprotein-related protein 2